jgi:hypothetical protein
MNEWRAPQWQVRTFGYFTSSTLFAALNKFFSLILFCFKPKMIFPRR